MDTFRIKIKEYTVTDQASFDEIKKSCFVSSSRHKTEKTNNAFRDRLVRQGLYVPKFHILETDFGRPEQALVLEFSAPKLVFGTNLKELTEKDFQAVVDKLYSFLKDSIGVYVFRHNIENAAVTLAAYSKNIPIHQFGSAQEVLRVIAPFDYRPRSEFTQVLYRQTKHTTELKYFNNNSHVTIYDKLVEIEANAKTKEEQEIIQRVKNKDYAPPETLRFELTLHSKIAVRQSLERFYGRKKDYTFVEAFQDKVCQTLLQQEVDHIFNHPLKKIVLLRTFDRDDFNRIIDEHCKTLAQKNELRVALDTIYTRGYAEYRKEVLKIASERTWFRKLKRMREIETRISIPIPMNQLDNVQVLEYILSQFGIESKLREPVQMELFKSVNKYDTADLKQHILPKRKKINFLPSKYYANNTDNNVSNSSINKHDMQNQKPP